MPDLPRIAGAQAYPSRAVRIIAPVAAGGTGDIIVRLIGQGLSERLGQPFVIENRPGAGTNVGTEVAVRAPADGYTLLLVIPPAVINATLYEKLDFNFIRDIVPVASISLTPGVVVVSRQFPVTTIPELIAYAKAKPGRINMASGGVGSSQHVYGELFGWRKSPPARCLLPQPCVTRCQAPCTRHLRGDGCVCRQPVVQRHEPDYRSAFCAVLHR